MPIVVECHLCPQFILLPMRPVCTFTPAFDGTIGAGELIRQLPDRDENRLLYIKKKLLWGALVKDNEPLEMAATYPADAGHHMRSALNPLRRQSSVYSGF